MQLYLQAPLNRLDIVLLDDVGRILPLVRAVDHGYSSSLVPQLEENQSLVRFVRQTTLGARRTVRYLADDRGEICFLHRSER